jgi:orotate phosphoribosyltransferase
MLVLVCGSREWSDHQRICDRLRALPRGAKIIHGGARGADTTAALYARALGIEETCYPARWRGQGKRAGLIRNIEMLDQEPDLVLAFWDGASTGTAHAISEAKKRGITVEIVKPKGSASGQGDA